MGYQNALLMLNILHRDFPDVAGIIDGKVLQALPKNRLRDLNLVESVVSAFLKSTSINITDWANSKEKVSYQYVGGMSIFVKVTDLRELLVGVVLMFFHPEKVLGYTTDATERGLIRELSRVMSCDKMRLSEGVNRAVSHYKHYKSFKSEVDHLYAAIADDGGYFKD